MNEKQLRELMLHNAKIAGFYKGLTNAILSMCEFDGRNYVIQEETIIKARNAVQKFENDLGSI